MKQIKVDVLFFGLAKELCVTRHVVIEVGERSTLGFCKKNITLKFPQLADLHAYAFAINKSYVNDDNIIMNDGDELAILPPVSGG